MREIRMKELHVKIILTEPALGMTANDPAILTKFIASKSPDAETLKDEVASLGVESVEEKQTTVFPRDEDGNPIFWDYQIKGFFKDSWGMLRRVPKTSCSKISSYKKIIDGLIFPSPRKIIIHIPEGESVGVLQRPLRASTPQGERVALASSESVPAGSYIEFVVTMLDDKLEEAILECLDYGKLRGLGQWRNSGMGKFVYEILD